MIKFEKVSYEQFEKDAIKLGYERTNLKKIYEETIKLPTRATAGSAGYDFIIPFDIFLTSEETVTVPTGIRCMMPSGVALILYPRSGIGFKTGTYLANTVGIIDSDYFYSDNEGHIMLKLVGGFKELHLKAGDKVMQGIFSPYLLTDDDNTDAIRNGGFGSTGK